MTVRETLTEGKKLLNSPNPSAFIDTPALDAALLLAQAMQRSRTDLLLRANDTISEEIREKYIRLLSRRINGECVAYILGRKEFRGLDFNVNSNVLVPRPDTETLVEAVLEKINSLQTQESLTVLDLCTGSGAVAVSLKNECPFLQITASDISAEALETAALNAKRLLGKAADSVVFIQSDLFEKIHGKFNLIVSNPPYVLSSEIESLAPELRREPVLALDGGADGLKIITKIINLSPKYLFPGGFLFLEAGPEQMPVIKNLLMAHNFTGISLHMDLAGLERVISGKYPQVS